MADTESETESFDSEEEFQAFNDEEVYFGFVTVEERLLHRKIGGSRSTIGHRMSSVVPSDFYIDSADNDEAEITINLKPQTLNLYASIQDNITQPIISQAMDRVNDHLLQEKIVVISEQVNENLKLHSEYRIALSKVVPNMIHSLSVCPSKQEQILNTLAQIRDHRQQIHNQCAFDQRVGSILQRVSMIHQRLDTSSSMIEVS